MGVSTIFFIDLEVSIHTHVIDRVGALCNDIHYNGTSVSEILLGKQILKQLRWGSILSSQKTHKIASGIG